MEPATPDSEHENIWSGIVSDVRRRNIIPKDGVIRDVASWKMLWKYWAGDVPAPEFDPTRQMVIVVTVAGPNRTIGTPLLRDDGRIEFAVGGTRMAGPGFGYRMAIIPKQGVRIIGGKPFHEKESEWVTGEILIPKELDSFSGATVEVSLFRTHISRTSLPAERIASCEVEQVEHHRWKTERFCFGLGTESLVRSAATYYVTLNVKQNGKRTHIGTVVPAGTDPDEVHSAGIRSMAPVLTGKDPAATVTFVLTTDQ
jgi:hypothetical protein